jgi:hypothetical protein
MSVWSSVAGGGGRTEVDRQVADCRLNDDHA